MSDTEKVLISPELLEILACPVGLAKLKLEGNHLVCTRCGTRFVIEEGGIPNMLIDEAVLPPGVSSYKDLDCWKEREQGSLNS